VELPVLGSVGKDKRDNEITAHCWDPEDGLKITYHRHSDDVYVGAKKIHRYYAAFAPTLIMSSPSSPSILGISAVEP